MSNEYTDVIAIGNAGHDESMKCLLQIGHA